jgi:hypothetical protein
VCASDRQRFAHLAGTEGFTNRGLENIRPPRDFAELLTDSVWAA